MAVHAPESTFQVRPFARRPEGAEVVIGDLERQVFLAVPPEGVDILDSLAAGDTVDEIARRHHAHDIDDFLDVMVAEGFLTAPGAAAPAPSGHSHGTPGRRSFSLDWISPVVARRLAAWPVVALLLATIAVGFRLVLASPGLMPGPKALLFMHGHYALFTVLLIAAMMAATALHELAHAVVARAAGVPVRLGFGNLMFSLVAQTDVSGLRMAPKRRRYLAFAAGIIVDLSTAALLVILLWADHRGLLTLPVPVRDFTGALLLTYLVRASFQLQFYMRTDLYYVVATAFGAKDMLADTEVMLRNALLRLTGRRSKVADRSDLTARERVAVRFYAAVYLVGRVLAFGVLFTLFLPVFLAILGQFVLLVTGQPTRFGSADFLVAGALVLLIDGGGIVAWVRGLVRGHRRRAAARAAAATAAPPAHEGVVNA